MPRGAFKSNRGRKERKIRAMVAKMPDRAAFFEHLTNLTEDERRDAFLKFGKHVGEALSAEQIIAAQNRRGNNAA